MFGNMHNWKEMGLRTRNRPEPDQFPSFSKPQALGFFSSDTNFRYHSTDDELRYFREPTLFPLDLNAGVEKAIRKPENEEEDSLDFLLRFILDQKEQVMVSNGPNKRLIAEFVSSRGLLRLIMCTPFERKDDWCIHIIRYKGTCYILKKETAYQKRQRLNETQQQKNMTSWGFKFEQYCLSKSPKEQPNTYEPVDECAKFFEVFHGKIQNTLLLYSAEMDGLISENPVSLKNDPKQLKNLKFVELKTRQGINCHERQIQCYKNYKTRSMWCQSILGGVSDIFMGLRDEQGLVHKIQHIPVSSLPKEGQNYWSPSICVSFLVDFMMSVRNIMQNIDCPYTVYEFYYHARGGNISYRCLKEKTEHSFLPDWYLQLFENIKNRKRR